MKQQKLILSIVVLFCMLLWNGVSRADHYSYAVTMLEKMSNPTYKDWFISITKNNRAKMLELIKNGKVNIRNNKNATPLHIAAFAGNVSAVRLLVQNGADIDTTAFGGWNALHYAAFGGQLQVAKIMVAMGIPINSVDIGGETPLFYAIESENLNMIEWMVNNGSEINHQNNNNETPLTIASHHVNSKISAFLENMGGKMGHTGKQVEPMDHQQDKPHSH